MDCDTQACLIAHNFGPGLACLILGVFAAVVTVAVCSRVGRPQSLAARMFFFPPALLSAAVGLWSVASIASWVYRVLGLVVANSTAYEGGFAPVVWLGLAALACAGSRLIDRSLATSSLAVAGEELQGGHS